MVVVVGGWHRMMIVDCELTRDRTSFVSSAAAAWTNERPNGADKKHTLAPQGLENVNPIDGDIRNRIRGRITRRIEQQQKSSPTQSTDYYLHSVGVPNRGGW